MPEGSKVIPMSKRFFPALLPIVGDETYKQVVARYQELFEGRGLPKHPALRWHLMEGILPGLAKDKDPKADLWQATLACGERMN